VKKLKWYAEHLQAYVLIAAFIAGLVPSVFFISTVNAAAGDTASFSTVGTHPEANAQSTYAGKVITDLAVDGGKLYAAYGDYDANTGPIAIDPFDLTTETFDGSQLSMPTEQVMIFRKINGKLYAPWVDPQAPWTSDVGYSSNESGTWQNYTETPAVHIFDMATLDGSDLWMVGASVEPDGVTERGATAFRSTGGGAIWNIVRTDASTPNASGYERYYWVEELNGKIYMQAGGAIPATPVRIFDGTTWSSGTTKQICTGYDPGMTETIGNYIVCANGRNTELTLFDGTNITHTTSQVGVTGDFYKDGGYLYALGTGGIMRTSNGINWTVIASSESTGFSYAFGGSLAIYNNHIYIGSSNGHILKSDQTVSSMTYEPLITSVTPGSLATKTKANIKIFGKNFDPGGTVTIGGKVVSGTYDIANSEIDVEAPLSSTAKSVDVVVKNSDGRSYKLAKGLRYYAPGAGQYTWTYGGGINKPMSWTGLATSSNGKRVIAVDGGFTFSSSNGGSSFKPSSGGGATAMSSNGMVVLSSDGGYLRTSTDGGLTWTSRRGAGFGIWLSVAVSANGTTMYASSSGSVLNYVSGTFRSSDGGATWHKLDTPDDLAVNNIKVSADGQHLVGGGLYAVVYSSDGGTTWQKHSVDPDSPNRIYMSNDGQVMIASVSGGIIYRSVDGGTSWATVDVTGGMSEVNEITGSGSGNHLLVAGNDTIYISNDAGISWVDVDVTGVLDTTSGMFASSANGQTVYWANSTYVFKSTDGGLTWQALHTDVELSSFAVAMSANSGYVVVADMGYDPITYNPLMTLQLYKNYGKTHVRQFSLPTSLYWTDVAMSGDGKKIAAVAYFDNVYISNDAGVSWQSANLPSGEWSSVASSADGKTILAAAVNGPVYLSRNSGSTWQEQTAVGSRGWTDVNVSPDGKSLLAVDDSGSMYVSGDSGKTLKKHLTTAPASSYWVSTAVSNNLMLASDYDGKVYKTTDNGKTWAVVSGLSSSSYWSSLQASNDGKVLTAVTEGELYVSLDKGKTWQPQVSVPGLVDRVAVSVDGKKIVAANSASFLMVGTQGKSSKPNSSNTSSSSTAKPPTTPASSLSNSGQAIGTAAVTSNKPKGQNQQLTNLNNEAAFMQGQLTTFNFNPTKVYTYTTSNNQTYIFRLTSASQNQATLKVTPGRELHLQKGAGVYCDLDGDGRNDMLVQLVEGGNQTAVLGMQTVAYRESTASQSSGGVVQPPQDVQRKNYNLAIITAVAGLLAIGIIFVVVRRRSKRDDNQTYHAS